MYPLATFSLAFALKSIGMSVGVIGYLMVFICSGILIMQFAKKNARFLDRKEGRTFLLGITGIFSFIQILLMSVWAVDRDVSLGMIASGVLVNISLGFFFAYIPLRTMRKGLVKRGVIKS